MQRERLKLFALLRARVTHKRAANLAGHAFVQAYFRLVRAQGEESAIRGALAQMHVPSGADEEFLASLCLPKPNTPGPGTTAGQQVARPVDGDARPPPFCPVISCSFFPVIASQMIISF